PYGECLGEILVRMTLRIPEPQALDELLARGIGAVVARISLGRRAEQLLPAAAAMQLIGLLHHVSGLMAQDAHALGPGATLDLDDHLLLELHQPRVRQEEGDRDPRGAFGAEPFARKPGVRSHPDAAFRKLLMQPVEAVLEPGAFQLDLEVLEPQLD